MEIRFFSHCCMVMTMKVMASVVFKITVTPFEMQRVSTFKAVFIFIFLMQVSDKK